MNPPITAVIFDFGNVFVKWDPYGLYKRFFPSPEAAHSFLEEINFTEWNALQDAGRPFRDGVAELSAKFPHWTEHIQAYDTFWEESITGVYAETIAIASELKRQGYKIYLLSNFSAEKFLLMQKRFDFLALFDDLIISGQHKMIKPEPEIFLFTLDRIQRTAAECLFIDDLPANINTARSLGFNTILFQSPEQLKQDLQNLL